MVDKTIIQTIQQDLCLSLNECEQKLETNIVNGLDEDEAQTRLESHGPNVPRTRRRQRIELSRLFSNLFGIHNMQLWFGAALCFVVYLSDSYLINHDLENKPDNLYVSICLITFVFAFGLFSYYMDAKCDYYVESCRDFVSHYCTVIRDGVLRKVEQKTLVIGDVILFRHGDQLGADLKLIECFGVFVKHDLLCERDRFYYRQLYGKNFNSSRQFKSGEILFHSSFVLGGHGKAIVMRTRNFYLSKVKWKTSKDDDGDDQDANRKTKNHKVEKLEQQQKYGKISHCDRPLWTQMNRFLNTLSIVAILISLICAIWSLLTGFSWLRAVMLFIAIYVGIITEALLPTLNVSKAQIAKELARKNCYIQNVEALETLGATSIICTNKTGVITQYKMIVAKIWIADHQWMPSYEFMREYKHLPQEELSPAMKAFVRTAALSTFGHFVDDNSDRFVSPFKRNAVGKPSEVALLRFMEAFLGRSVEKYQHEHNRQFEVTYNYQTKCSYKVYSCATGDETAATTTPTDDHDQPLLICIKGEPEQLIRSSGKIFTTQGLCKFSYQQKQSLIAQCDRMGRKKYRPLAIAQAIISHPGTRHLHLNHHHHSQPQHNLRDSDGQLNSAQLNTLISRNQLDLQFLGLIVLENPVRLTVPEAIFKCRQAGIKVIMVTADHPQTALSIAKTVGIVMDPYSRYEPPPPVPLTPPPITLDIEAVLSLTPSRCSSTSHLSDPLLSTSTQNLYTCADISHMTDAQLKEMIATLPDLVFARIEPKDKLRIVNCCRRKHEIVAVTGVGATDLHVFERANIRISLGEYGADIAKHNSDVILLDDNFSTIICGIEEGRVLFENLRKSLCYTLSSKPAEIYPYLLSFILAVPKMDSSITILALDLITDNLQPIALGYEKAESMVMHGYPRYLRDEKVVNFETVLTSICFYGMIQFLSGSFAFVIAMAEHGFWHSKLLFIRDPWYSAAVNDLEDSYGQEWTYIQRSELEFSCHTVYFVTVVLTRIAVLFACRTRRDSCIRHLFNNSMVNFSIFFSFFGCAFLSYYKPLQYALHVFPIKFSWWLVAIPFFFLTLSLEEGRKYILRTYPNSAVANVFQY